MSTIKSSVLLKYDKGFNITEDKNDIDLSLQPQRWQNTRFRKMRAFPWSSHEFAVWPQHTALNLWAISRSEQKHYKAFHLRKM